MIRLHTRICYYCTALCFAGVLWLFTHPYFLHSADSPPPKFLEGSPLTDPVARLTEILFWTAMLFLGVDVATWESRNYRGYRRTGPVRQ